VAGRRSWVDAWLGPALRSAGASVSAAPAYYDYQAMIEHDLSSATTARLFFFGADDRFALDIKSPSADDPGLGGPVAQKETFLRLQARLDSRLSERTRWINMVSLGNNGEHFALSNNTADATYNVIDSRLRISAQLGRTVTAMVGVALLAGHYDVTLRVPTRRPREKSRAPFSQHRKSALAGSGMLWRLAGRRDARARAGAGLKIVPGLRVDYSSESGRWTADPRRISPRDSTSPQARDARRSKPA
jgi:hypothetical protein